MNNFAKIYKVKELSGEKVTYYTLFVDGEDVPEFFDFLNRMEEITKIEDDLSNLITWIQEIADKYGALKKFFRYEGIDSDTSALPPPRGVMRSHKIEVNDLRLYCFVLNENVVFLFNGDIKSNVVDAKDCPRVGKYIRQANRMSKAIDQLIKDGEIQWNKTGTDIIFQSDLEITL
jgi:hypothetical protein